MDFSKETGRQRKWGSPSEALQLSVPKVMFPNEPAPLKEFICNALCEAGLYKRGLFIREISRDRLDFTLRTGHDRDNNSNIDYFGDTDGESAAMEENGLSPILDKHLVTYVSLLDRMHHSQLTPSYPCAYLVFMPDALEFIGTASNGFAMFTNRASQLSVLNAVFVTPHNA